MLLVLMLVLVLVLVLVDDHSEQRLIPLSAHDRQFPLFRLLLLK
jgi:hypothetical protein